MDRARLACDRCHELKIKCLHSLDGCRRCTRLDLACTYQRTIRKPGRKPTTRPFDSSQATDVPSYPILRSLQPYGVGDTTASTSTEPDDTTWCSSSDASQLLDNFFGSPDQVIHGYILRRVCLLRSEGYRETSAAVLLALLCLSCYMPTESGDMPLASLSCGERERLRNLLHSAALKLMDPVFLGRTQPSFDDAVAALFLCAVATSDNDMHAYLPQRLSTLKFLVKQLNLNIEPEGFDEESKEERRRLWWSVYIVDRHSSFSFNMRPSLVDSDCQNLYRPCPDSIWQTDRPLAECHDTFVRRRGVDYEVYSLDWFGMSVPLFAIIGDALEYHFIAQHRSFGTNAEFLLFLRGSIEQNLKTWESSVRHLCSIGATSKTHTRATVMVWAPGQPWEVDEVFPAEPKLLLYAWHMFHCIYIVLHAKLDLIQMFHSTEWLLSKDFLVAAEHAGQCAKITGQILAVDPKLHLCLRLFGTYLLHSSFIFLILAKKLRHLADAYILNCCQTNLRSLDVFASTISIGYQKTFARILRETVSKCLETEEHGTPVLSEVDAEGEFDPELLKYRWTVGYNGLWIEDMGRPEEAKKRKFEDGNQKPP